MKGFFFGDRMYTSRYDLSECKSLDLKGMKLQVLEFIIDWIQTGKVSSIVEENQRYYWISLKHVSEELGCSYSSIKKIIVFLQDKLFLKKLYKCGYSSGEWQNKMYLSINFSKYLTVLKKNSYNNCRRNWCEKNIGEDMESLFGDDVDFDNNLNHHAEKIANKIIENYSFYFKHRIPDINRNPTKLYSNICKKIYDIFNGDFTNVKLYPLESKIENWKEKVNSVKGDWKKVESLIFSALKNFELMHDKERMPYSKKYLQNNLSNWFYDSFSNEGKGTSQFVNCLEEPAFISNYNSEKKADKIYETLSTTVKIAGNKLFAMNKTMASGLFWENVKKLVEWSKTAFNFEKGMMYWLGEPDKIVNKFYEFCDDKNISISTATVDIEKAVKCSGPLVWFLQDACNDYDMKIELADCSTPADIIELYE